MTNTINAMADSTALIPTSVAEASVAKAAVHDRLKKNNFDGLRLIFAGMVVLFHISILSQSAQLAGLHIWISSTFAVQAFFVVSGFLVVMSYENAKSFLDYGKKRLFRIAPAYVSVILICAFALVLISDFSFEKYFSDSQWRSYTLSNLILSNFKQPTLPGVFTRNFDPAVNGSLWTIKLEVMFYCLVPAIVWAIRRFGYKPVLTSLVVFSIIWHGSFLYVSQLDGSDFAARLAKQLPGQLAFFAGGAFAYYRTREGLPPPSMWSATVAAIIYAMTPGYIYTIVAPFCVTLMVYWASISVPQVWSARRWGDFSYGLYLYHFPIVQVLVALGAFTAKPVLGLFAACGLALLASIVSWHLIEKRALRFTHPRSSSRGSS